MTERRAIVKEIHEKVKNALTTKERCNLLIELMKYTLSEMQKDEKVK